MNSLAQERLDEMFAGLIALCDRPVINPGKVRHRKNTIELRSAMIEATARALVAVDNNSHHHPGPVSQFWGDKYPKYLIGFELLKPAGGLKVVRQRIKQGGLGIEHHLGDWTADFLYGLKLSGYIRQRTHPNTSYFRFNTHRRLETDLNTSQIPHRFSKYSGGTSYLSNCPLMLVPPEGNETRQLAGVFAGSKILKDTDGEWLSMLSTEYTLGLLKYWDIPHKEQAGKILVSPFFGAIFSVFMPDQTAEEILTLQNPAQCPLLPCVYFQRILAKSYKGVISHSRALPFGMGRASFFRRGWSRREIDQRGLTELGIVGILDRMRELIIKWHEAFIANPHATLTELRQIIRQCP